MNDKIKKKSEYIKMSHRLFECVNGINSSVLRSYVNLYVNLTNNPTTHLTSKKSFCVLMETISAARATTQIIK